LVEFSTNWAIVYNGQFFENYRSSQNFCAAFSHDDCYVLILTKKTKTFWANKSGQPDEDCLFFQSEERYVGESQ
jgi:hypothetical protein